MYDVFVCLATNFAILLIFLFFCVETTLKWKPCCSTLSYLTENIQLDLWPLLSYLKTITLLDVVFMANHCFYGESLIQNVYKKCKRQIFLFLTNIYSVELFYTIPPFLHRFETYCQIFRGGRHFRSLRKKRKLEGRKEGFFK